jgi:putative transposase
MPPSPRRSLTQRQANPKLANWLESNLPEGFTVFSLPKPHRQRLRTNNMLARLNRELRRRSRIIGVFPNEESLLRLAGAKTMEISDEWEAGKRYLHLTCE